MGNEKVDSNIVELFNDNGFVLVPQLLDKSETLQLEVVFDSFAEKMLMKRQKSGVFVFHDIVLYAPEFMNLATNNSILNISTKLLSSQSIRLQHSKINFKQSNSSLGYVPWHQDFPFFPHTNTSLLGCTVFLSDTNISNGGLLFAQGSQKNKILNHYDENDHFLGEIIDQDLVEKKYKITSINAKAGDVLFHHCKAIHSSRPNTTKLERKTIVFQHVADDSVQVGGRQHKCHGLYLRGNQSNLVRFDTGENLRIPSEVRCDFSPLILYQANNKSSEWGENFKNEK